MSRYEIIDREHPEWRGMRFASLDQAERELARAEPASRFYIRDRQAKAADAITNTTPTDTYNGEG